MYYANAAAPPTSNPDQTFDFFDDFSGSVLDTNKWNVDSTVTSYSVANSKLTINGSADSQWAVLKGIYTKNNFPLQNGFAVEVKDFTWNEAGVSNMPMVGITLTNGTSSSNPISEIFFDAWADNRASKYAVIESSSYYTGYDTLPLSGTSQFKITKGQDNNTKVFLDDNLVLGPVASTTNIQKLYILVNKYASYPFGTFTIDRILVRKHASSEPVISILSEQSQDTKIQDLAYTYDADGNITRIVDNSATNSKKTVDYTYDALNRLLSATSTGAINGQNYTEIYSYDAIGSITNKSDQSAYTYSQTGKTNPHAVTSVGGTNYTYDDNGNLLTVSGGLSNTWDYDNRLTQSVIGSTTVNYSYDASGQRIKYSTGATTTVYPSKYYNTDRTTPVKHIYAGDQLIATIKGTGASAAVYPIVTDHLTGSNIVTNSAGTVEELMDYYPYGDIRLDEKAGSFSEQRKFAGHEYDTDTGLSYMNARYYNGKIGRFVSQDPAYLAVGDSARLKEKTRMDLERYLSDPQLANSYSYVANNPLKYTDSTGDFLDIALDVGFIGYDLYKMGSAAWKGNWSEVKSEAVNLGLDTSGALVPFATGLGMARRAGEAAKIVKSVEKTEEVGRTIEKVDNSKNVFTKAAEHSDARNHYPGKSVQEIENIAKNTYNNFDIKVNIKGVKKYYYNSKTNDLFINNLKQPTIFSPGKGPQYLKDAVKKDIEKGGRVK